MLKQYFDSTITGIEAKLAAEPDRPRRRKLYALELARLGRALYGGEGKVAWCGVVAPFDLLRAMDVTSCFVEFVGAMLASTEGVGAMLEQAEQLGFSDDGCSYHRAVQGAADQGLMPVPDFLIATSCPCSGGLAALHNLAQHFSRDLFVLDVPQQQTDEAVSFLAGQLREMVTFVERHTGARLDSARLGEAVLLGNRTRELLQEVYALAAHVPSPVAARDLKNFGVVMALFFGSEAGVRLAQTYRDELSAAVERGEAGVEGERLRLLWIQNRIQFRQPVERWLEGEWGCAVVCDEFNDVTWDPIDPDDPYTGMARRIVSFPTNGPVERRIEHLQDLARRYQVHGAINPCHWGCRQGAGSRGLVAEGLREVGVPVLNLEVDCVDPRNFAEGQLRTRIGAFVEMLEAGARRGEG